MLIDTLKTLEDFNESTIIDILSNYIVDVPDLIKIDNITKQNIEESCRPEYKKIIKNTNLVLEIFKYSKHIDGEISLLGLIYKFENIFQADITTLMIKIGNKFYTNIHIYVPISNKTYSIIKNDLHSNLNILQHNKKQIIIDHSTSGLPSIQQNHITHDRIAGKVFAPIIVKRRNIGELIFYYIDYKTKRKQYLD